MSIQEISSGGLKLTAQTKGELVLFDKIYNYCSRAARKDNVLLISKYEKDEVINILKYFAEEC